MKSITFLCDSGIVPEQISLGIGTEEGHTCGKRIFDVWIKEISGFARTARRGDKSVHIIGIHQSGDMPFWAFAAHNKALLRGQIFPQPPLLRLKRDVRIG